MNILFLESFFGGSHKEFALHYCRNTSHRVELITLPARHWKWRQAGSALAFLEEMENRGVKIGEFDRVIATDLTDLNLLKSLIDLPPVLLYMHESQFHYPLSEGEIQDFHYGFKDFTNILAADRVVFNSRYHGNAFFSSCRDFLSRLPDFRPLNCLETLKDGWDTVYPGFSPPSRRKEKAESSPPIILWNHRWEHDKNPADFFRFLCHLKSSGQPFRLYLLGERFSRYPEEFDRILKEFSREIIFSDYCETREEYWNILFQSDFVVSTSLQENFGISVVEAVWAGAVPLLPNRLSYPEILPDTFHGLLFESVDDLTGKFIKLSKNPIDSGESLREAMECYSCEKTAASLDQILGNMA